LPRKNVKNGNNIKNRTKKVKTKSLPKLTLKSPKKEAVKALKDKGKLFGAIMDTIGDLG